MEKVTKEGFEPYITISKDYSEEPCGQKNTRNARRRPSANIGRP